MKILLTGGGTAGHVYPAIAIAEYIRALDKHAEILFVGRQGGDENKAVTAEGFKLKTIEIKGLGRSFGIENINRLALALKSVRKAKEIILSFKPDAILGTGGYVSFPCLKGGISLGVPTFIHESNVSPGLVTRLVSKKCDKLLINMDGTRDKIRYKQNIVTVGNPLRMDFGSMSREKARQKLGIRSGELLIVSFGGSGGSERMNEACINLMKRYSQRHKKIKHVHATGVRYYKKYREKEPSLCSGVEGCKILKYIDNMPIYLLACDIAICRCGAITLSELACVGAPSILIPSPNVTGNHQYKNALYFKEHGAAILLEENALDEHVLLDTVKELEGNKNKRASMSENINKLYVSGSAELIYNEIKKSLVNI